MKIIKLKNLGQLKIIFGNAMFLAVFFSIFAVSCKSVKVTRSRSASVFKEGDAVAISKPGSEPLVKDITDVPLSELGMLSVSIEVEDCLGEGKWLDPARPASPEVGLFSLTPMGETDVVKGTGARELVFEPIVHAANGKSYVSAVTYSWRLEHGAYHVRAWSLNRSRVRLGDEWMSRLVNVDGTAVQKLSVKGTWDPESSFSHCQLVWQP